MNQIEETGGVRIGLFRASWPLASIAVDEYKLEINASIKGKFVFDKTDIVSVTIENSLFKSGLRIKHRVEKYNNDIVFYPKTSAASLVEKINQIGFLDLSRKIPIAIEMEVKALQQKSGFPIKIPMAIGIVIAWNLLFLADFLNVLANKSEHSFTGIGVSLALAMVFVIALLLLISSFFRQIILKDGVELKSIKTFLFFILFLTGILFCFSFLIPKL
ncbi:hypothetical protein [Pedobacter sp. Leaf250]|uniref:hypothetical protein n=1 Tax=Pedobacter sp. Leaf250 TaxID=2876559 RepID=UPI001E51036D|nr:hypothetical protein [Pedobacter sp. Leaf250]